MKVTNISTTKIIGFFLRDYYIIAFCIFISALAFAIFESINVATIFPVVNSILTKSDPTENYGKIIGLLYQVIYLLPFEDMFISSCVLMIISSIMKFVAYILFTYFSYKLSLTARSDLQNEIYEKILFSDYQYFVYNKQGSILYRLLNAPANVGTILKLIPDIFVHCFKIILLMILLFSASGTAFILMMCIGLVFALIIKKLSNRTYDFGHKIVDAIENQTNIVNESISGIRQIIIYISQQIWIDKFKKKISQYYRYKLFSQLLNTTPAIAFEPLVVFLIAIAGIILKLNYKINFIAMLPILTMYALAIIRISPSITNVGQQKMLLMNVMPDLEICYSSLNSNAKFILDGHHICECFKEKISYENVSFSYPNGNTVFENLTIKIKKGQITAIVGESGAGKSTLMDLLVRLYDPTGGTINIDNVDLKSIKVSSWRNKIGYVSQEPFILNSTILENITFGNDAYDMKEIVEAAKAANAHDFINAFPDQYQTVVGERGMSLSGGQKQRIAIARAIVRKPEIIIFDEATSALDNISEKLVKEAIDKISTNYTVIIIAHRLSTIQNADNIMVVGNKNIQEKGTHIELLKLKGIYWELYNKEDHSVS